MNKNNGNGSRPKVDPQLGEEVHLRLLKAAPFCGKSSYGDYWLYSVLDLSDMTEKAFFAPEDVFNILNERKLGEGSEFLLKKVATTNGSKKIVTKLEVAFLGGGHPTIQDALPSENGVSHSNGYKDTMLKCMQEAVEISKDPAFSNLQFRTEDIRSMGLTLYISRSKTAA